MNDEEVYPSILTLISFIGLLFAIAQEISWVALGSGMVFGFFGTEILEKIFGKHSALDEIFKKDDNVRSE